MQLMFSTKVNLVPSASLLGDDFDEHSAVQYAHQNHQKGKRPWGQDWESV